MTYAVIIDIDAPPAMVPYEGFTALKKHLDCDMAEVAARGMVSDIPVIMLVDEEGLLRDDAEYNDLASLFYSAFYSSIFPPSGIVGICALVKDTGEDLVGFSLEEAQEVLKFVEELS